MHARIAWGAGCVCLALSYLMQVHRPPWTGFLNELSASLALVLMFLATLLKERKIATLSWPLPFICLVATIPLMQWLGGIVFFFGDAVLATLYLLALSCSIRLGYSMGGATNTSAWSSLAITILSAASISALVCLFQYLRIEVLGVWAAELAPWGRPYGNIAQANHMATLALLGLASLLYLRTQDRVSQILTVLLFPLNFLALALTQSKTAWVCVLLLPVVMVFLARKGILSRGHVLRAVAGVVVFFALVAALPSISGSLHLYSETIEQRVVPTSSARLAIFQQMLVALADRPLSGWGWNQVAVAQVFGAASVTSGEFVEHTNNVFLDLFVWNGIVAGFLICAAIVWWFCSRTSAIKRAEHLYAGAMVAALAVHAMFEFPLDYMYFIVVFGIGIGCIERAYGKGFALTLNWRVASVVPVVMAVAVFVISRDYFISQENNTALRFGSARIGMSEIPEVTGKVWVLDNLEAFQLFARSEAKNGMGDAELQAMGRVVNRYPFPPALFRYVLANALNGRMDEARFYFKALCGMHPIKLCEEARGNILLMKDVHPVLENILH